MRSGNVRRRSSRHRSRLCPRSPETSPPSRLRSGHRCHRDLASGVRGRLGDDADRSSSRHRRRPGGRSAPRHRCRGNRPSRRSRRLRSSRLRRVRPSAPGRSGLRRGGRWGWGAVPATTRMPGRERRRDCADRSSPATGRLPPGRSAPRRHPSPGTTTHLRLRGRTPRRRVPGWPRRLGQASGSPAGRSAPAPRRPRRHPLRRRHRRSAAIRPRRRCRRVVRARCRRRLHGRCPWR